MKKNRRIHNVNNVLLAITILALCFAFWSDYEKKNAIAEQETIKSEIIEDCNNLTIRNTDLEKHIKLLEEKVKSQQEAIDRLMMLETVSEVKSVAMSEARGESLVGQAAIIQSMLDRSTEWNKTVNEVINAEGQYASPYKGEISDSVNMAFELVFLDGFRVFEEPTTHFATYEPYWAKNKTCRGIAGRHRFYF